MRDIYHRLATWLISTPAKRQRFAAILLVAIAARMITFGNPIVHVDEQFYFATADAWLHGALPYVDVWDRKPIGLFLIYLPAAALGFPLGIWAYQAVALASLVATAWLIARLADRAGWGRGALGGALAYIIWVDFLDGQGGQAPIFYNLLMVGAATLIAPRPNDAKGRIVSAFAAMALVGLSLQVKYSAVFEGLFFGVWLLVRAWRVGWRWSIAPYAAGLVAITVLPTLAAWFAFDRIGAGDDWVYANFSSILARKPDPFLEQLGNLMGLVLITSPLIAASILAWGRGDDVPVARAMRLWLFAWLAAATLGLLVFGSYFEHYALPLLVPASICASGFFGDHHNGRRIVLPLLLVGFLGSETLLVIKRHNRGTAEQFSGVVDAIGHGPGCLYVFSGDSMLYPASGRCALTRYIFPSHLGRVREQGAIGVDQQAEIEHILSRTPEIVVFRPPYPGERAELRAMAIGEMRKNYRLRAIRPLGRQAIEIYERARP